MLYFVLKFVLMNILLLMNGTSQLLKFVSCVQTQQQQMNFIHTTATLSQARYQISTLSIDEFVLFVGWFHNK
jgi:hypothetical protein